MIEFPISPAPGEIVTAGSRSWQWDSSSQVWNLLNNSDVAAATAVAAAAAAAASASAAAAAVGTAQFADYVLLRNYAGPSKAAYITGYMGSSAPSGFSGLFTVDDSDVVSADNGGTIIVATNGKRWKRVYDGPVQLKWFNAVGDNVNDDTAAIVAAIAAGSIIEGDAGKTYRFSSTLTLTEKHFRGRGCTFNYVGAAGSWAMVINANTSINGRCRAHDFVLRGNGTDIVTRTHGLNLGGGCGVLDNVRVEGFTGVSIGLGAGVDPHSGVNFPATSDCYYWLVSNCCVASTSGWMLVIQAANNANEISNFETFPYNGFSEAPPRSYNCIDEVVIGGTGNTLTRISLEGSPSNRMVLFLPTASGNEFIGQTYLERNASWQTPPFPRIEAQAQSSSNKVRVRHPYSGQMALDLGTANDIRADPAFYVNGQQFNLPADGISMVKNGRFENKSFGWSDFSVSGVMSFVAGYLSGSAMRVDVAAGRPNVLQDLVAVGGYTLAGLRDQNITVAGYVRTNLAGLSIKVAALTQGQVPADSAWHWFTATIKVPTAAASVPVQLITESGGLTGFVEWSDVSAVFGCEPLAAAPRDVLEGSATYNPPNLAAGVSQKTTVTVSGAVVGDHVISVAHTQDGAVGADDITWSGKVTAADTVTVWMRNNGGGAFDMASGTLSVRVRKA